MMSLMTRKRNSLDSLPTSPSFFFNSSHWLDKTTEKTEKKITSRDCNGLILFQQVFAQSIHIAVLHLQDTGSNFKGQQRMHLFLNARAIACSVTFQQKSMSLCTVRTLLKHTYPSEAIWQCIATYSCKGDLSEHTVKKKNTCNFKPHFQGHSTFKALKN